MSEIEERRHDMARELGRVEGILESVVEAQKQAHTEAGKNFDKLFALLNQINANGCSKAASHADVDERIRRVELTLSKASGWMMALGGLMGIIATLVTSWVKAKFFGGEA